MMLSRARDGRSFPWRTRRDAYGVLIGEVLLQRTRGEHAVDVFEDFLRRWPDAERLARAREKSIASVILPLGLAKRASLLKRLALALREAGSVPRQRHELLSLPGVGPYTANAVLVFALGRDLPLVDWVIARVLRRYFGLPSGKRPNADRDLWIVAARIEIIDRANPFLAGVMEDGDAPVWWLEGSSYPIRILAPERVQVLLSSAELAGRYGEAPVAIQFRHGAGEVFHMISHYYLQRTELRGERHAKPASCFAEEKGIVPDAAMEGAMAGLKVGDVESAHASARFLSNVIAKKKRGQASVR